MVKAVFATVVGGPVDYEFLLGGIRHHATLGEHVVLDVTPKSERRKFLGLPDSVIWINDDAYASGTPRFAFRPALKKALRVAHALRADVVMHLDSDEFVAEAVKPVFEQALSSRSMIENLIVTWGADGLPRIPEGRYSRRIWPSFMEVEIPPNLASIENIENHPIPLIPHGTKTLQTNAVFHHHLHWIFPQKGLHTFKDFPVGGYGEWPKALSRWKSEGVPPSVDFGGM